MSIRYLCGLLLLALPLSAQEAAVAVGSDGVMRWSGSGEEVALFGVNYTAPFAYAYRAHGYVGADRKASIDADVAHLARLGVDAYRVHVWEREISDREGNLVENDHLDLLDYLLARLYERNIRAILTPIFGGGTGYPESNPATNGFSEGRSKGQMTVDAEARALQRNYFQQFVRHVNPYTGQSYAEDPRLLAIEIFNEPSHPAPPEEQTRYIDEMAQAIREAGFVGPVLYNISIGWSDAHARAVCSAAIQGVTFQWYPSGLVRNSTVRTNMLPNVDRYPIPFIDIPECHDKSRLVYEFDAADVMGSYMYPAMARAFRGAGMQWATQFAYDPMAIANVNTEYQTHYLNLVYTPAKAISFLIAGEAFRRIPRGAAFGSYPASSRFGPFHVDYAQDLSELATDDRFYHSRDTDTAPPSPMALRHIAGTGNSPLVTYEGTGAYFLDRLEEGVWRLEVYPDAIQTADPFGRARLDREVTRLFWRDWPMHINLADLGTDFSVRAVNAGNDHDGTAANGTFSISPGVYVLRRQGVDGGRWTDPAAPVGELALGEFHVPVQTDDGIAVVHHPAGEATEGVPLTIRAEILSTNPVDRVELRMSGARSVASERVAMERVRGMEYQAVIDPAMVTGDEVRYAIAVVSAAGEQVFPRGSAGGQPVDSVWRVPLAADRSPITLLDVARDQDRMLNPHPYRYVQFRAETVEGSQPDRSALRVQVESFEPDPHHYAVRSFLGNEYRLRLDAPEGYGVLKVRARTSGAEAERLEVALVDVDGVAWGAVIPLTANWRDIEVQISELRPVTLALLPRPYPEFLPNEGPAPAPDGPLDLRRVDGVQVRIGSSLYPSSAAPGPHGFEIERVVLERGP